jgi:hypothetical protein
MRDLSPIDELIELRSEIARLRRREATLCAMVEGGPAVPSGRAGWPIRMSGHMQAGGVHA